MIDKAARRQHNARDVRVRHVDTGLRGGARVQLKTLVAQAKQTDHHARGEHNQRLEDRILPPMTDARPLPDMASLSETNYITVLSPQQLIQVSGGLAAHIRQGVTVKIMMRHRDHGMMSILNAAVMAQGAIAPYDVEFL